MNLSKASVKGLGVLISAGLIFGTGMFVINPLVAQRAENISDLKSLQTVTETKKANLERLSKGSVNFQEAFEAGNNFEKIVPKSKDIESASRAISEATVSGVTITSFTFNPEEPVSENKLPAVSIDGYKPPTSFAKSGTGSKASPKSGSESKPATGSGSKSGASSSASLNRLPMTISVTAESYQKLSEYTDQLSREDRLLSVISISSNSKEGIIKADIYAYAFIDKAR